MKYIKKKQWTILIYANGNNDMEPEMYRAMKDLESVGCGININVVLQIGRTTRELAKNMRPLEKIPLNDDYWTGVRRYTVKKYKSTLTEELGKINMADPNTLYEFLKYGIANYRAKHYMLILSGHGISFIGGLTDLSYNKAYVMGLPEMAKSINMVKENLNCDIDILVLDMCFMNFIETIYEFGCEHEHTVKNILTYIGRGPFTGLPYDKLISLVGEYNDKDDLRLFLRYLIQNLDFELIAYELNSEKLLEIKSTLSSIATVYLSDEDKQGVKAIDLIKNSKELNNQLTAIIIYYRRKYALNENLISIITEKLGKLTNIYCKLSFAKDNMWVNLLCDEDIEKYLNTEIILKPMVVSKQAARRLFSI